MTSSHAKASLFTSSLVGIRTGCWLRCLLDNHFQVDPQYVPRAVAISLFSIVNSVVGAIEGLLYANRIQASESQAPLFILGQWRSGTTHLHQLLSLDGRFVTPDLVQVMFPSVYLLLGSALKRVLRPLLPETRLIDEMKLTVDAPGEDEFALAALTGYSPYLAYAFPRRWDHYDDFIALKHVEKKQLELFKGSLEHFVAKLVLKSGKTPLLKSPAHTARISLIRSAFPRARYLHISRHPYEIFQSTRYMMSVGPSFTQLQKFDFGQVDEIILRRFQIMLEAYLDQRKTVPTDHLHELRFEDLLSDPVERLRIAYDALNLDDFESCVPTIENYLDTLRHYSKTKHQNLNSTEKQRVRDAWGPYFEAFGYQD